MSVRRGGTQQRPHDHQPDGARPGCLYETAVREAIATQHALADGERLDLRACEGCGKPFLLKSVWQPFAEEGELACPRCGVLAASWDGPRAYVAYWQREHQLVS